VQIFAPYTVLVGPDAAPSANIAQIKNGTSYSSPYVAGVAALVWAAEPSRSADQVEAALMNHARSSPDYRVTRIINAFDAVKSVLGHIPPAIQIIQPASGTAVEPGGFNWVTFEATVDSYDATCCGVAWSSDKDGSMGNGTVIQFTFGNIGTRIVTATATDGSGATSMASIVVNVSSNTPPTVKILKPSPGQTLYRGVTHVFHGTADDPNENLLTLSCSSLKWVAQKALSNLHLFGDGCWPQFTFPEKGPAGGAYTITLIGTDSTGATGTDTLSVQLVTPPVGGPPAVTILSPHFGMLLDAWGAVTLKGTVKDPDGKSPVSYRWLLKDGATESVLATGTSISGAPGGATVQWKPLNNVSPNCSTSPVTIVLQATDIDGETASGSVDVSVQFLPC
jgi:serine protease